MYTHCPTLCQAIVLHIAADVSPHLLVHTPLHSVKELLTEAGNNAHLRPLTHDADRWRGVVMVRSTPTPTP